MTSSWQSRKPKRLIVKVERSIGPFKSTRGRVRQSEFTHHPDRRRLRRCSCLRDSLACSPSQDGVAGQCPAIRALEHWSSNRRYISFHTSRHKFHFFDLISEEKRESIS